MNKCLSITNRMFACETGGKKGKKELVVIPSVQQRQWTKERDGQNFQPE